MPFLRLKIPVLVKSVEVSEKSLFYLRPLFIPYPLVTNRRFDDAVNSLTAEVKNVFKGFLLSRENADHLLWFLFHPDIRYQKVPVSFKLGKFFLEGDIGMVAFPVQDLTFVLLPAFNNYIFMADPVSRDDKSQLRSQVENAAKKILRRYMEEQGDDFSPESYVSDKREFVTEIQVNLNIRPGSFNLEAPPDHWFFTRMASMEEFDGAQEVERAGYDLNGLYPSGLQRAFHRESWVQQLYTILYQEGQTPVALVGPEGVGRHTLLQETVWRYIHQNSGKPGEMISRVWHIDPTRIISGMSIVGMWQKRLESIVKFLRKPHPVADTPDKIMVDNPVALLRIGKSAENDMTLSDVLKPYLEKRQLQLILIATPEEWKVIQVKDRRFSDLFQVIRLPEPDLNTAAGMVLQQRKFLEGANSTVFSIQAVKQLFYIQRNYLSGKALPGSIMKLMNQLAVKYRYQKIDAPEVRQEFKMFSGLEEQIFDAGPGLEKNEVRQAIGKDLVGQPAAVDALADVVHLIKAKLTNKKKPISSFLFIGPTGVGKTQAAKVLCQYLMGSEDHLLRFDMNEYIDAFAAQRLIGDYYQPEGQLTGKVRYKPFGVLLLDEIEKAHPKIHDLLLQVLDDGRLTDSLGRTVDFTNMIIIMTSNIGAREASVQLGFKTQWTDEGAIYRKAVENHFRPEFINRIDKVVIFNPLSLDHILNIARLQIRELLKRDGFVRRTTILNISQQALEWVARRGYNARMGGRALKRQIEKDLTALSAEQLLASHTDQPILLDITFRDGHLIPEITTFEFAGPLQTEILPEMPDLNNGRKFYSRLLQAIEKLEYRIRDFEENRENDKGQLIVNYETKGSRLNWQYYHFKNKIAETKERIQNVMLGFRDHHLQDAPSIPLRLKPGFLFSRYDGSRGARETLRDRLFQEEALREISEAYQLGLTRFDSFQSEYLNHYFDVAFLQLLSDGFLRNQLEKVQMSFRSCITGLGDQEIKFLIERYAALLDLLDIPHKVDQETKCLTIEGYSVYDLLRGEEGIQLFCHAHQNLLPIQVRLQKEDEPSSGKNAFIVIRIYDGGKTLTDLRTGYTNAINITAQELKFLLLAGLSPDFRKGSTLMN